MVWGRVCGGCEVQRGMCHASHTMPPASSPLPPSSWGLRQPRLAASRRRGRAGRERQPAAQGECTLGIPRHGDIPPFHQRAHAAAVHPPAASQLAAAASSAVILSLGQTPPPASPRKVVLAGWLARRVTTAKAASQRQRQQRRRPSLRRSVCMASPLLGPTSPVWQRSLCGTCGEHTHQRQVCRFYGWGPQEGSFMHTHRLMANLNLEPGCHAAAAATAMRRARSEGPGLVNAAHRSDTGGLHLIR